MLALSQQQRASSVHHQLGAEDGVQGGRCPSNASTSWKRSLLCTIANGSRSAAFCCALSIPFGSGIRRWRPAPRNSAAGRAAARLAAGVPLAAAGAMGRAPRRRARAQTPFNAALRTFLADPLRAAGGGRERAAEGGGGWRAARLTLRAGASALCRPAHPS